MGPSPFVSVVIITRSRARWVRGCLEHLYRQDYPQSFEIIVVDSSSNEKTQRVLDDFPEVRRARIPDGRNNMPQARNLGILHSRGDVIAFLDDDSYAHPTWLSQLMKHYAAPDVGGVGGRLIDPTRPLFGEGVGAIRLYPHVQFTCNFTVDTVDPIDVDWLTGGNMSFRRSALQEIGKFDHRYTGWNSMEEVDVGVRVKQAEYRLVYEPRAVVDHLALKSPLARPAHPKFNVRIYLWSRFHRQKNLAYFWFKNFGVTLHMLRHIFGGLPLLRLTTFLKDPSLINFVDIYSCIVGGMIGLVGAVFSTANRNRLQWPERFRSSSALSDC
jgi:glycosyltransferase involved in cell wall biosynthesis